MSTRRKVIESYNEHINDLLPSFKPYDFINKESSVRNNANYILARTSQMFEYGNLPDTIDKRVLELYLQRGIHCAFVLDSKNDLYVVKGNLSSECDAYFNPLEYIVENPWKSDLSKTYHINKDCVIIFNDSAHVGLNPLITKYSTLLMENEISLNLCSIMSRATSFLVATNDSMKKSAEKVLEDILIGKLGVIGSEELLTPNETFNVNPNAINANQLTNLIEYHQYIKASLFNELGLNANYNMKRESINGNEADLNNDILIPLIDDMLNQRKLALEKVNELFGINITVSLSSVWKENEIEREISIDNLESEESENEGAENED